MPILFIPNDPLASGGPANRTITPRAKRHRNRAGYRYVDEAPEGEFDAGTPEFLYWQCREAALLSIDVYESTGRKLSSWQSGRRLDLIQNGGVDLNAYYNRASLSFFEFTTGQKTTFSGASTDVVAHEAGHALLDMLRPDIWSSFFTEVNAFHEAFGDCIAIFAALSDAETRSSLLNGPGLGAANFVEATAEDLSDAVKRELGASHPAAKPRRALNDFKWQMPFSLPLNGGPDVLTREVHSFGRVFSGCYYDAIRNIFANQGSSDADALAAANLITASILFEGVEKAIETPRFFQSVGQAMVMADQDLNGGANRRAIIDAFDRHSISLGTSAALAPSAGLEGRAPRAAASNVLTESTREDLRRRLNAPGARLSVTPMRMAGESVAKVVHHREIDLGDVHPELKDVMARAAEPVVVGSSGRRAAVLGMMPHSDTTADEVKAFVEALVQHNQLSVGTPRRGLVAGRAKSRPTHAVRKRGAKKVVTRLRYACPL